MRGLIISEFEAGFIPALWTYPKENRIVARLRKATLRFRPLSFQL